MSAVDQYDLKAELCKAVDYGIENVRCVGGALTQNIKRITVSYVGL